VDEALGRAVRRLSDDPLLDEIMAEVKKVDPSANWSLTLRPPEITTQAIVKSFVDVVLVNDAGNEASLESLGMGSQRRLVAKLLEREEDQRRSAPLGGLVLYEEPELFLHPPAIATLCKSLRSSAARASGTQVVVTTHSPEFAAGTLDDISSIVRLSRDQGRTQSFQVTASRMDELLSANEEVVTKYLGPRSTGSHSVSVPGDVLRYAVWLDQTRSRMLFSSFVLLVEGPSDRVCVEFLLRRFNRNELQLTVVDTLGKQNMHRFMNLLSALGIRHSVIIDGDDGKTAQWTQIIHQRRSVFCRDVLELTHDVERELGLEIPNERHLKPLLVYSALERGDVGEDVMKRFWERIERTIVGSSSESLGDP
jgi:hypothetical protein